MLEILKVFSFYATKILQFWVGKDRPILFRLWSSGDEHTTFSAIMFANMIFINPEMDEFYYDMVEARIVSIITHETLHIVFWNMGEVDAMYALDDIDDMLKCDQWLFKDEPKTQRIIEIEGTFELTEEGRKMFDRWVSED